MSYYLIEDIDSIHPSARFGYDGQIAGPFSSKQKAMRWLKDDAAVAYAGADEYRLDGRLEDHGYFSKWGLVKLDCCIKPVAVARVSFKVEEST